MGSIINYRDPETGVWIPLSTVGPEGPMGPSGEIGPPGAPGAEGPNEVSVSAGEPTDPNTEFWIDLDAGPVAKYKDPGDSQWKELVIESNWTDEVSVGPTAPTDANFELWVDSDATGLALTDLDSRYVTPMVEHGLVAWTYDPALAVNSTVLTGGTVYLARVRPRSTASVTKIYWHVATVAVTPTSSQNEIGIYSSSGTRLVTANVDADVTSTGLKVTTIASTELTAGSSYWIAMVFNASTPPALARSTGLAGASGLANAGLTAVNYRFATNGTTQTALPATITPASNAAGLPLWVAVG